MSYVDLNPVRAGIADTPETSDFTSVQQRIRQHVKQPNKLEKCPAKKEPPLLMPLGKQGSDQHKNAIGFNLVDYLQLIDWAGRIIRDGGYGAIPEEMPPILQRTGLEPKRYLEHLRGNAPTEGLAMLGRFEHIKQVARALGRCFIKGAGEAQLLYRPIQTG
jgi:hypothetical protein